MALFTQPLLVEPDVQDGDDLKAAAIDGWRRICLVPEKLKTVRADTALRGNQM